MYYLDNAATTKPFRFICENYSKYLQEYYANPSALYSIGVDVEKKMENVRELISAILKVRSSDLYFTSSATESNNIAIMSYLKGFRDKKHVICSAIEHPSVYDVYKSLESEGWSVDYAPVNIDGTIDINKLEALIKEDTVMVSLMSVNNETGAIQPYDKVKALIKKKAKQCALHVDSVQAFGKVNLTPIKHGIDMMTISSHKVYGPKGVSCLYLSHDLKIKPVIFGGGQEKSIRPGTENAPAIIAFGDAVHYMLENFDNHNLHMDSIKKIFLDSFIDNTELRSKPVLISNDSCIPYIISIAFPGIRSEVLLHHLEMNNVIVSSGSACSNNKNGKSRVLQMMGYDNSIADSVIRISPSVDMSLEDAKSAASIIVYTVNQIIGR